LHPLRVVIDTNVIVSALLTPGRTPALALDALHAHAAVTLVDAHIEAEYRAVLVRPKFQSIDPARREALLHTVLARSERVHVTAPSTTPLIDNDDRRFIDVALAGRADVLLTGNAKHYPTNLGFAVCSPASLLERLERA
jgi:putative PIN family toxin of toxin-antitoxin system